MINNNFVYLKIVMQHDALKTQFRYHNITRAINN